MSGDESPAAEGDRPSLVRELSVHEDHYQTSVVEAADQRLRLPTGPRLLAGTEVSDAELGLSEGLVPKGGLSRLEELEVAMETCKDLVRAATPHTEKHKALVAKLVALRFQHQELKESALEESGSPLAERPVDVRRLAGHGFQRQEKRGRNPYCERCQGVIWRLVQPWFRCKGCGYRVHEKCLELVRRTCAALIARKRPSYILALCPEKGLAAQKYRCAECRCPLAFASSPAAEPRLCHYSGLFFCPACHWRDTMVIPARVVHNWDFTPRPVARSTKQLLEVLSTKPLIHLEKLNPALFSQLQELRELKKTRSDILVMKCYFVVCGRARAEKLLWALRQHQHFVEGGDLYSLSDLVKLHAGTLHEHLQSVLTLFGEHIRSVCVGCRGKGFVCEYCTAGDVIFPFDAFVALCKTCLLVSHRRCFEAAARVCKRCERREKRKESAAMDLELKPSASPDPSSASASPVKAAGLNSFGGPESSPSKIASESENPFGEADSSSLDEDNPFRSDD